MSFSVEVYFLDPWTLCLQAREADMRKKYQDQEKELMEKERAIEKEKMELEKKEMEHEKGLLQQVRNDLFTYLLNI